MIDIVVSTMSASRITDFFRTKKSSEPIVAANNPTTDAEKFYRNCLQQKKCDEISCLNLKKELNAQLTELNNKIRYHEEAVNTCKIIINDKEIEINRLEMIATSNAVENGPQQEKSRSIENVEPSSMRFSEFSKHFTTNQLAELRSIEMSSRLDSSFVMTVLKFIYADNLESLKSKSVTGRCNKKDQIKTKISPEKDTIIRNIFERRMSDVTTDDQGARKKNSIES